MQHIKNNTNSPNSEKEIFWKNHFKLFQASNLSKASYSRQHKLVEHCFIYWCGKFEKQACKVPQKEPDFLPIKIEANKNTTTSTSSILCTLELGCNKKIFIHNEIALKVLLEAWT